MKDNISIMRQLIEELNHASESYYSGQQELLTDFEWDAKFDELKMLEQQTGVVLPESPTQKVSETPVTGKKEEHEYPALSLAKTKLIEDIVKWAEGKPIWISWKLDGLTLVATYDNGQLSKLVTRGNGHVGTNITHLSDVINGIPKTINYKGHLVVRGEAVISYADFNEFLIESGEDYANPRNLASGTMTLLDISEVRRRKVNWKPFTLVYIEEDKADRKKNDYDFSSWGNRMEWLESQGFNPVEREKIIDSQYNNIKGVIDLFTHEVTTKNYPYPVDGLVVTYDDVEYAESGSVTGHHATRAGLAFKWQDESRTTQLKHIEWSCAANYISPVAVFEPVELEGTIVKRASLCNISECERLGIGDKGSQIEVIKANKIIPKVINVLESKGQLVVPEHCPVCHAPTRIDVSEFSGTKTLRCQNDKCPAKELKKFARFVSKDALDIDGLSEQTLQLLVAQGWIQNYVDIYRLSTHSNQMISLEGMGTRSVEKLLQAIEKSRKVEASKLLFALSIPQCGTDICKRFLNEYSLHDIVEKARNTTDVEEFCHIKGIGKEISSAMITWMKDDENYQKLVDLMAELDIYEEAAKSGSGKCENLTFVITGTTIHYANRDELKKYIEQEGGRVAGSVSGNTDFLINNDVESSSGKNKKAKELGITIISEEDFIKRFVREELVDNNEDNDKSKQQNNNPLQMELF